MRKLLWAIAVGLILSGCYVQFPAVQDAVATAWSWVSPDSTPVIAVVVRESADTVKLGKEQIAWMMSPKLREDAKAAGVQLLIVDPDVVDATGKTPPHLAPVIEKAKAAGLPRLVMIGSRGGLTVCELPADEAAARKRIGL